MNTLDAREVGRVIRQEHWKAGKSLRQIERELGVGKSVLSTAAKRHGIAVRTKQQQVGITNRLPEVVAKRSGERHGLYGKSRPDAARRMRERNPMSMPGVRERAAIAQADTLRQQPSRREVRFIEELAAQGVACEFQHPVGRFVLDFAFPSHMVALEIDGKTHHIPERKKLDARRDAWLVSQGWRVVRYYDVGRHRPGVVLSALSRYVPGLKRIAGSPCRVLVRDRETPAGRVER